LVWRGYTLNDFQTEAVEAIEAGSDVLVSAPTGAGKTLVAEYAIHDAVARGRRAIYTAPIKALSNQKFRDFRAQGLDTGLMTGDVTIAPGAQVLVMTTEILRNSILEDPRSLSDVGWVVFDEVHYRDDLERFSTPAEQSRRLCELNVAVQVVHVRESPILHAAGDDVKVHGWIYDVADGRLNDLTAMVEGVRALEPSVRV
jgi:replicative superfamily II helicase